MSDGSKEALIIWNEVTPVWRKARKQFECEGDGCTKSIEPGDRYLDQTLRDAAHVHIRYCLTCGEPVMRLVQDQYKFVGQRNAFADRYQHHVASGAWNKLKAEVIELRGQRCQRCRQDKPGLALHHLHYRTLGHETPDEVELLCADCHEIADAQRRKHNSLSERIKRGERRKEL